MKSRFKYHLWFILISFIFTSCGDDKYIVNVYNKELLDNPIKCVKLNIVPFSKDIYSKISKLYPFDKQQCLNHLIIKYKSNIICTSPYNTKKNFHSFVDVSLAKNNTIYYSVYKDLEDNANLEKELYKIFNLYILKHLNND